MVARKRIKAFKKRHEQESDLEVEEEEETNEIEGLDDDPERMSKGCFGILPTSLLGTCWRIYGLVGGDVVKDSS